MSDLLTFENVVGVATIVTSIGIIFSSCRYVWSLHQKREEDINKATLDLESFFKAHRARLNSEQPISDTTQAKIEDFRVFILLTYIELTEKIKRARFYMWAGYDLSLILIGLLFFNRDNVVNALALIMTLCFSLFLYYYFKGEEKKHILKKENIYFSYLHNLKVK